MRATPCGSHPVQAVSRLNGLAASLLRCRGRLSGPARGSILLIIRLGNIDLELANSPAMDAPGQYQGHPQMPGASGHAMMPGMSGHAGAMGGMMLPGGPMMGAPGMQMPVMTQPSPGALPNMPMPSQPGTGPDQSSRLPDPASLQQTRYGTAAATAARLAGDAPGTSTTEKKKPVSQSWWWGGDADKK